MAITSNYNGTSNRGAPVQADGTPVYYSLPASWAAAQNDGERWRWALQQTALADPERTPQVQNTFASSCSDNSACRRWRGIGYAHEHDDDADIRRDESGPYALATLKDNETIARLANGIKRFTMPDEFNYIKIFQQVAESKGRLCQPRRCNTLGGIFADRRQYRSRGGLLSARRQSAMVKQILGNWGEFEGTHQQPTGVAATVPFRFRNGKHMSFTAQEIDVNKLLDDVKAYINANPGQLDWQRLPTSTISATAWSSEIRRNIWAKRWPPGSRIYSRALGISTGASPSPRP